MKDPRRRYWLLFRGIGIGLVLFLIVPITLLVIQHIARENSHDTFAGGKQPINSSDYKTQAEKIAFLKTRLNVPASMQATEFSLYEDTFLFFSTYRYRIAVKVSPTEIDSWLQSITNLPREHRKNSSELYEEGDQFFDNLLHAPIWERTSKPEYFQSVENMDTQNAAIIYRKEGIILLSLNHSTT
ncbi:MAG: hypothetical protein ACYDCO_21870 [Armatimonadota bacterium]